MAILKKYNVAEQRDWDKWVESRPAIIRKMARKFPVNKLYREKTHSLRVIIYSYNEDGTLTVIVSGDYNYVTFEYKVFGVKQDNLEECELPSTDEPLGVRLTGKKDIDAFINVIRPHVLKGE